MQVWRISKAKYAATAYSGEGARLESGRWHQASHRVVYTSASAALAALEILVHTASDLLPRTSYVAIPADIPEDLTILRLTVAGLARRLGRDSGTAHTARPWHAMVAGWADRCVSRAFCHRTV